MKRVIAFLLLGALFVLGACAGTEPAAEAPVAGNLASAPEVVVYLSPT